jgi:hypothetical protein
VWWYSGTDTVDGHLAFEGDTPGIGQITISDPDSVNSSIFAQTLAFWRDLNLATRSSAQLDETENPSVVVDLELQNRLSSQSYLTSSCNRQG